ncbi:MAG: response regulator [Anaerolineales bacterium]|nr:response regulator [Anaerolineales bacterium]
MLLTDKRIFVVEDNVAYANILMTALQMQGAQTYFDRWGTHTINRLLQLGHIDIILMDLMLANNISGYDVFDEIQAIPELSTIPVVVVSASDATLEMDKCRKKGFAGFISKPISLKTLPQTIARVLTGTPVWADEGIY